MICRALVVGAIGLLTLTAAGATAAVSEGARLAFVRFGLEPERLELVTSGETGAGQQVIAGGGRKAEPTVFPFVAPSWSPDGSLIAFSGLGGGVKGGRRSGPAIFVTGADGAGLRRVTGTKGGIGPVFAPDGHTIAFARTRERRPGQRKSAKRRPYISTSTWLADLDGDEPRRITPWRNGLEMRPTSFSPDGTTLALARQAGPLASPEIVVMRFDGGGSTVLVREATDAVYSPDGATIAFARVQHRPPRGGSRGGGRGADLESTSDLFTIGADGSGLRRLTDTPDNVEIWPSWDPSGQRLAYTRLRGGFVGLLGFGDAVMQINADGSCERNVLAAAQVAFYGPTWQPGPGREAGRLAC